MEIVPTECVSNEKKMRNFRRKYKPNLFIFWTLLNPIFLMQRRLLFVVCVTLFFSWFVFNVQLFVQMVCEIYTDTTKYL